MAGETGPITTSRTLAMVIAALFALSCYNVLEITISIFTTFRRRHGLYFWSMLTATLGILLHAISGFLRYFAWAPNFLMSIFVCIGWYAMVTGQSVVLFSRLHLVTTHERYPRWVLYMIIFDFCALHVPTTILFLGSNHGVQAFIAPFNIYERVQLAGFSVQETVISALYVWETMTNLRPVLALKGPRGQRVLLNIVLVNVIAVLLDMSLLATQYTDHFDIQTTFKPLVYSIKLKMEFTVLNSLLVMIRSTPRTIEHVQPSHQGNLDIEPGWSGEQSVPDAASGIDLEIPNRNSRPGEDQESPRSRASWRSYTNRLKVWSQHAKI